MMETGWECPLAKQDSAFDWKATGIAAGLLFVLGACVAVGAMTYEVGTLRRMGPGYFPLLLGVVLCLLSVLVLVESRFSRVENDPRPTAGWRQHARALLLPLGGILLFAGLITIAGFIPAILGCTVLAGLADRTNRLFELFLIAAAVAAFAALVFVYALGIPVRLFAL